jgi:hypothetical protein
VGGGTPTVDAPPYSATLPQPSGLALSQPNSRSASAQPRQDARFDRAPQGRNDDRAPQGRNDNRGNRPNQSGNNNRNGAGNGGGYGNREGGNRSRNNPSTGNYGRYGHNAAGGGQQSGMHNRVMSSQADFQQSNQQSHINMVELNNRLHTTQMQMRDMQQRYQQQQGPPPQQQQHVPQQSQLPPAPRLGGTPAPSQHGVMHWGMQAASQAPSVAMSSAAPSVTSYHGQQDP